MSHMTDFSIAIDESGRHGPNLMAGGHFIVGSTSLTNEAAADLLAGALGLPPQTAREWKWKYVREMPKRAEAVLAAIDPRTTLVAVIHHRFFCWAKAVDTLIYEFEYNVLGEGSFSRQFAMVAYAQEAWECVRTHVDPFLQAYVDACRSPGEKSFYWVARRARQLVSRCPDGPVREQVLKPMARAAGRFRELLLEHVAIRGEGDAFARPADHIDPHVAALGALANGWRQRTEHGGWIDALHDEIVPNDVVDRWTEAFTQIGRMRLSRGKSLNEPRLQLADLIAGAAEAALRRPSDDEQTEIVRALAQGQVTEWIPRDLTICAWRDPVSQFRPEGAPPPREDYDW